MFIQTKENSSKRYKEDDCELFENSVYIEEISDILCIAFSGWFNLFFENRFSSFLGNNLIQVLGCKKYLSDSGHWILIFPGKAKCTDQQETLSNLFFSFPVTSKRENY